MSEEIKSMMKEFAAVGEAFEEALRERDARIKELNEEVAEANSATETAKADISECNERVADCAEAYGHVLAGDMGGARDALERALDRNQQFEGQQYSYRVKGMLETRRIEAERLAQKAGAQ